VSDNSAFQRRRSNWIFCVYIYACGRSSTVAEIVARCYIRCIVVLRCLSNCSNPFEAMFDRRFSRSTRQTLSCLWLHVDPRSYFSSKVLVSVASLPRATSIFTAKSHFSNSNFSRHFICFAVCWMIVSLLYISSTGDPLWTFCLIFWLYREVMKNKIFYFYIILWIRIQGVSKFFAKRYCIGRAD